MGDNNNLNMSEEDLQKLNLLNRQLVATVLNICSDYLAYIATLEGIELLYDKYTNPDINVNINPDIPALQSAYLAIIARLMLAQIAFIKYDILNEQFINGEISYSIRPNAEIVLANIFGTVSNLYTLSGTQGIFDRDLNQPVFGV